VRGEGLLLVFELVSDRQTMAPLRNKAHVELVDTWRRGSGDSFPCYAAAVASKVTTSWFTRRMITTLENIEEIMKSTVALEKFERFRLR
jgi:hypothetical protein